MIRLTNPSFVFNAHDMEWPTYRMWHSVIGRPGTTPAELTPHLLSANVAALSTQRSGLQNIVFNCHGYPGGLYIGGLEHSAMHSSNLESLAPLRSLNLGTVWLTSCGAAEGDDGHRFCATLARTLGTFVIAADESQVVGVRAAYRIQVGLARNLDEFEGRVFRFKANGSAERIDPHTHYTVMS